MRRLPLSLALGAAIALIAAVAALASPAGAQDVDAAVSELEFRGYYIEPGAPADVNDFESLVAQVDDSSRPVYFVALTQEAEGGNDLFAQRISDDIATQGTVFVVDPGGVGAVSVDYDDAAINRALDEGFEVLDRNGSLADVSRAFASTLTQLEPAASTAPAAASSDGDGDGGGSGFGVLLVVVIVIALAIGALVFFARRKQKDRDENDLENARAEIRAQLDTVASELLENEERVQLSDKPEAVTYYREASETYASVIEQLDDTTSLIELSRLNDQIDRARWQLDAAEAVMDGTAVPPEPSPELPEACFFDPTHRRGTAEATIRTPAGEKPVKVCPDCAEKLRRGERPEPRMIDVGRRRVPAGAAPRTHGGGGFGDLLGPFSILLGGLASGGLDFDWGGGRRSRGSRWGRSGGTGLGGPILGGGSRSSRSRPSSSGRSSSRPTRRPTVGRGRRRR